MADFAPLSAALTQSLGQLANQSSGRAYGHDRILYSGNPHDALPRRLFLDQRLTPLERNAWQACRLLMSAGDSTTPTYEHLRSWLASTPWAPLASHETVARALTVLRLTRWLSLIRRRRAAATGRLQGNVYVLHDEPLIPFEAMQLEPDYLQLISESLEHASKVIRHTARTALHEISQDSMLSQHTFPTRLEALLQRAKDACDVSSRTDPQSIHKACSEVGKPNSEAGERSRSPALSSDSEESRNRRESRSLRIPKQASTVNKYVLSTVLGGVNGSGVRLPSRFTNLKQDQQAGILMTLAQLPPGLRQAVLDEWDARCARTTIRNPAGYLFGTVQKAIRGEFKSTLSPGA